MYMILLQMPLSSTRVPSRDEITQLGLSSFACSQQASFSEATPLPHKMIHTHNHGANHSSLHCPTPQHLRLPVGAAGTAFTAPVSAGRASCLTCCPAAHAICLATLATLFNIVLKVLAREISKKIFF